MRIVEPETPASDNRRDAAAGVTKSFDVARVRADFPVLSRLVHGKPLVYLDSAATSQKPHCVIDRIRDYYENENANIHRGVYVLSEQATASYEAARRNVQSFFNARSSSEIVFVRGTTEGINLVASSVGRCLIAPGDEVVISHMEHHSNIVPWQMMCEDRGAVLRVIPMNERGELLMEEYGKLLGPRTKVVAVSHQSNALGTINPVREIIERAHAVGAKVLLDGAQAAAHMAIDVQNLDCDFYVASGHKLFGPTGIGVLYGKAELLETLPPYQGGGDMIRSVTFEKTTYAPPPSKFEAGTPNIVGAIALSTGLDYLRSLDLEAARRHEQELLRYATDAVGALPGVRLIGTAAKKASVMSFTLGDVHPHDIGTVLDQDGIAIRAGHHCAQPIMRFFGVPATARASFAFYNTKQDVDALVKSLENAIDIFE